MSSEIHFEIDSSRIDRTYGVLVTLSKKSLPEDVKEEDIPYYLMVFNGPEKHVELEEVTKLFGLCHQDAMDSVGLFGTVTPETFDSLLEESIELAGEMMSQHGLDVLDVDSLDEELIEDLFQTSTMEEVDPKLLN